MQELRSLMEQSYRFHPAFHFDKPSWAIPEEKLIIFNETYAVICQFGSRLDVSSRAILKQNLLKALGNIFASLQAQSENEYETLFLLELRSSCIRLLEEELVWYFREPQTSFANLISVQARRSAALILKNRYFFGCLPQAVVSELRNLGKTELNMFHTNVAAGRLKREDLSVNSGATVSAMRDLLNREFKALGVLDAVSAFTGRKTQVVGLALELSVPQASWWKSTIQGLERSPNTLYAHLDETISCPKSIVYLSDVTKQNGPTGCYPGAYEAMQLNPLQEIIGRVVGTIGTKFDSPLKNYYAKAYHQSMNSENFRRHFMRLPESLRFNSHMGWDVLPGSGLESQLTTAERRMIGPAGTFIVFDGARLFHRGGLMETGERLALQVIFSDVAYIKRAVRKLKRILL